MNHRLSDRLLIKQPSALMVYNDIIARSVIYLRVQVPVLALQSHIHNDVCNSIISNSTDGYFIGLV